MVVVTDAQAGCTCVEEGDRIPRGGYSIVGVTSERVLYLVAWGCFIFSLLFSFYDSGRGRNVSGHSRGGRR